MVVVGLGRAGAQGALAPPRPALPTWPCPCPSWPPPACLPQEREAILQARQQRQAKAAAAAGQRPQQVEEEEEGGGARQPKFGEPGFRYHAAIPQVCQGGAWLEQGWAVPGWLGA